MSETVRNNCCYERALSLLGPFGSDSDILVEEILLLRLAISAHNLSGR